MKSKFNVHLPYNFVCVSTHRADFSNFRVGDTRREKVIVLLKSINMTLLKMTIVVETSFVNDL